MINKVNQSEPLPRPNSLDLGWAVNLVQTLFNIFSSYANTINALVDSHNVPFEPVTLPTYLKTTLPDAAIYINSIIIVSNDTGGLTPAFSDGTNWRRTADRNIIS